jgi:hypothetical protein
MIKDKTILQCAVLAFTLGMVWATKQQEWGFSLLALLFLREKPPRYDLRKDMDDLHRKINQLGKDK